MNYFRETGKFLLHRLGDESSLFNYTVWNRPPAGGHAGGCSPLTAYILGTKSSEEEAEIRSDIYLKETYPFSLDALYHSIRREKEQLEDKGISIKDFRYERLTDNPGKVDIFIRIESEKH